MIYKRGEACFATMIAGAPLIPYSVIHFEWW